jgi:hypothetical protein
LLDTLLSRKELRGGEWRHEAMEGHVETSRPGQVRRQASIKSANHIFIHTWFWGSTSPRPRNILISTLYRSAYEAVIHFTTISTHRYPKMALRKII